MLLHGWAEPLRYSGAHLGHSLSLSARQRWWKLWRHRKCTAGSERLEVQAWHLMPWKVVGLRHGTSRQEAVRQRTQPGMAANNKGLTVCGVSQFPRASPACPFDS